MSEKEQYLRFSLPRRVEHWVNVTSFSALALTGLTQKYSSFPFSLWFIRLLGSIESIRIIHRVAAVVLALIAIFHVGVAIYHLYVKRGRPTMLPNLGDVRNAWQILRHNLGFAEDRPQQDFYTFEEKVEYWALMWGMVVMGLTGFFLWNPITAARFLPGQYIPAAKAAHGGEAVLAVLAIIIWHLYHVLIRHFNRSMYTGYLSLDEMKHEHPLALKKEWQPPSPTDPGFKQRRKTFWIGYSVVALIWLLGVRWFVTSEVTASAAVETIPNIKGIEAFNLPKPTPYPTQLPTPESALVFGSTWENGMGNFISNRCGDCHHPVLGDANLDLTTYTGAILGGDSGPAVVPYGPGVSLIAIWPNFDWHPGKFSPVEAAAVRDWIQNGAIEK